MFSAKDFVSDRFRTLRPANNTVLNPLRLLGLLTAKQWSFWLLGFFAWSWDAFDFHSVTLSYPDLSATFNKTETEITNSVTLALMTRPIGGIVFGGLADRYGRKWPFVANCCLLMIFVLATGFCQTFRAFLAVRALFGIAMGGIYGNAAATALEDCPEEARGLISGLYQSGFLFGYILASVFYRAFKDTTRYGWRPLFWFGAAPPVLLIIFRLCLPETDAFQSRRLFRSQGQNAKVAASEVSLAVKKYWLLLAYLSFLLAGMVYLSHSTQDIYPTLLKHTYGYSVSHSTIVQIVGSIGGMTGGAVTGYCSQIFGRRFSIILMCILGGGLLYPYAFTAGPGIYAAAFFEQLCVQGAWGIIPIHLIELSPAAFRAFVVGTSYQLGVLIASPCDLIIATIGQRFPLQLQDQSRTQQYDYRVPIAALTGGMFAYVILLTAIGPEKKGKGMAEDDSDESDTELTVSRTARISHGRF